MPADMACKEASVQIVAATGRATYRERHRLALEEIRLGLGWGRGCAQ